MFYVQGRIALKAQCNPSKNVSPKSQRLLQDKKVRGDDGEKRRDKKREVLGNDRKSKKRDAECTKFLCFKRGRADSSFGREDNKRM